MSRAFYLLRHGEVEGYAALNGRTDVPLSLLGVHQMHQQAALLGNIDRVCSSPLQRCQHFAKKYCAKQGLSVELIPELRECDFGKWDGVPFDDIPQSSWPELQIFWDNPVENTLPGAEPLALFFERVRDAWHGILADGSGQNVLLVTHGGVIRMIVALTLHIDWRNPSLYNQFNVSYGSLSKISLQNHEVAQPVVEYVGVPWSRRSH